MSLPVHFGISAASTRPAAISSVAAKASKNRALIAAIKPNGRNLARRTMAMARFMPPLLRMKCGKTVKVGRLQARSTDPGMSLLSRNQQRGQEGQEEQDVRRCYELQRQRCGRIGNRYDSLHPAIAKGKMQPNR